MSCFSDHSRTGVPTAPRKYLLVTMFEALTDQVLGNSTPRCSKLTDPSRQLVMTTSRRSQVTWSYGCTPGVVYTRRTCSPRPTGDVWGDAGVPPDAEPLTVSVMRCPASLLKHNNGGGSVVAEWGLRPGK